MAVGLVFTLTVREGLLLLIDLVGEDEDVAGVVIL